jgi:hypothetical protein
VEQKRTGDVVLAGIVTLLLSDVSPLLDQPDPLDLREERLC